MPWIEIALPGAFLLVKFLLKLVVDRSATLSDFIAAVLALPVDIVFLSASLIAGHVISSPENSKESLGVFVGCMFLAALIITIWRRSDGQFTKDKYILAGSLGLFNVGVSTSALLYSISLLSTGGVK